MLYSDLPQNKERIYIIGFRDEKDAKLFILFDGKNIEKYRANVDPMQRINQIKNIVDYKSSKKELKPRFSIKKKIIEKYSQQVLRKITINNPKLNK